MTPDEIEGELHTLRQQISQLQQQQERQKKHWFRWGLIAACIGLTLAIAGIIIAFITVAGPTPPVVAILVFAALQLLVLNAALGTAGLPPANLPLGSRLKWGWSD
jgi:Mg/Co/Ni transporter MgtE